MPPSRDRQDTRAGHARGMLALAAVLACVVVSCSAPRQYVNPNVDLSEMKTVAVLPFDNVSGDRSAGEKVLRIFVTELLATGSFDVLEPGSVVRVLQNERIELATLSGDDLKKLGKALNVQGIFIGTIIDYEEGRAAATTGGRVTIQLRLVDAASGKTFWNTSRSEAGDTVSARLFGIGAKTGVILAEQVLRDELRGLVR